MKMRRTVADGKKRASWESHRQRAHARSSAVDEDERAKTSSATVDWLIMTRCNVDTTLKPHIDKHVSIASIAFSLLKFFKHRGVNKGQANRDVSLG